MSSNVSSLYLCTGLFLRTEKAAVDLGARAVFHTYLFGRNLLPGRLPSVHL